MNHIDWLVEKILEFDSSLWTLSVQDRPDMSIDQWMEHRIRWGLEKGFVWFEFDRFSEPQKAVCMRPINEAILKRIESDYIGSIWDYDSAGKIVFIDFRYGEGSIPMTWDLCRASRRLEVAYYHHQKLRRVKLENVPRVPELLTGYHG